VARNGIDGDRLWVTTAATANTSADASTSDTTEDAVRDVRGVRVGDDDNANEPERDTECGGGGELLVGGDETRERGRHDGDETQQNGGDAARDVPLAGEEKRVMGSDNERTADEHVDIVVPSPGRKSAPEERRQQTAARRRRRSARRRTAPREGARPTSVAMNAVPRPHTAARSGRLSGSDSFTRKSPTDCEICVEPHWLSERQGPFRIQKPHSQLLVALFVPRKGAGRSGRGRPAR